MFAVLVAIALFAGMIALVVRLSGRRFPGDITGPQGNEVDYDDPYPGWNIWTNKHPPPPSPLPTDFDRWESEQSRDCEE